MSREKKHHYVNNKEFLELVENNNHFYKDLTDNEFKFATIYYFNGTKMYDQNWNPIGQRTRVMHLLPERFMHDEIMKEYSDQFEHYAKELNDNQLETKDSFQDLIRDSIYKVMSTDDVKKIFC